MIGPKATARPTRADRSQLRQLQVVLAVARCIRTAAEYSDDDIDLADALAGVVILLDGVTATLDAAGGAS